MMRSEPLVTSSPSGSLGALLLWGKRALRLLVVGSPAAILSWAATQRRWLCDDAFIDLRVVAQLLSGHGPVFNLGERVEAYTNPLWVALLTLWGAVGAKLEFGAVLFGIAFSISGLLLAQAAAADLDRAIRERSERRSSMGLLPLGALVWASLPAVWDFSSSGLETGLTFFWMGGSYWLLASSTKSVPSGARLRSAGRAVVYGIGTLIRPDLAVFSVGFLVAQIASDAISERGVSRGAARSYIEPAFVTLLFAVALPGAYQVFRMGYFAGLVPNTALAKEAGLGFSSRGFQYALDFGRTYLLPIPLALLFVLWSATFKAARRKGSSPAAIFLAVPLAASALHMAYVVWVGGDFMHARLLLPSLFGCVLPCASIRLPASGVAKGTLMPGALVGSCLVIWCAFCAAWLRPKLDILKTGIVDERAWYVLTTQRKKPVYLLDHWRNARADVLGLSAPSARVLVLNDEVLCLDRANQGKTDHGCLVIPRPEQQLPLAPSVPAALRFGVVRTTVGSSGYALGPSVLTIDRMGLGDPVTSRVRLLRRGRIGHEKMLSNAWFIARFTEPLPSEHADIVAARRALSCGALRELLHAISAPLSARLFLQNLRNAFAFHRLRYSEIPQLAERQLCEGSLH